MKPSRPSSLSLYRDIVEIDTAGRIGVKYHSGQLNVVNATERFVFMISGAQAGKTILGPLWLYEEIRKKGAGDYLAVTSNYTLFRLKMLPAMLELFDTILHVGKWWAGAGVIEIAHPKDGFLAKTQHDNMWARIILRSAASKAGLESATAKAAWLDECGQDEFKYEAWEAVQRRLSIHQGRVLGTTTPYNLGWLKVNVYDRWIAKDPDYRVIQFASTLNPQFPMAEFYRAKRTLPRWRFEMFYEGKFVKPFGLIYSDFDDEMLFDTERVVPTFQYHYPRWMAVDFGGANTATIYAVEDITQTPSVFYLYQEFLEGGMSSKEHVKLAKTRLGVYEKLHAFGGNKGETQQRKDWAEAGIDLSPPVISDVEVGISKVIELMKAGRLKVSKDLLGLRHELSTYRRVTDIEGNVSNTIQDKETFHRLDALRYLAIGILGAGGSIETANEFADYRG